MADQKIDYRYKLIMIGESNVGKTSLLRRYKLDEFHTDVMNTIGVDTMSKKLVIDSKIIMLNIWDTAGQERFRSITKNYYRNIDGVLLVFDLTDERTFDCIDNWYDSLQEESPNTPLFLVGNKSDQIPNIEEIRNVYVAKANQMKTEFYATSAKENVGVSAIFEDMAVKLTKTTRKEPVENVTGKVKIKSRRKWCC